MASHNKNIYICNYLVSRSHLEISRSDRSLLEDGELVELKCSVEIDQILLVFLKETRQSD